VIRKIIPLPTKPAKRPAPKIKVIRRPGKTIRIIRRGRRIVRVVRRPGKKVIRKVIRIPRPGKP
jgi:hypothetical protein